MYVSLFPQYVLWWRRALSGLCCVIAFLPGSVNALSPQEIAQSRKTAERVHRRGGYENRIQLGQQPKSSSSRPSGCLDNQGCLGCQGCARSLQPLFQVSAGCAQITPWIFLALAVLLLMLWLRRYMQDFGSTRTVIEQVESTPTLWGMELPVHLDPEQLAAQGKFDLGIGILLWRALRQIGWKPEGIGKSQTPREVIRSLPSQDVRLSPAQQLLFLAEKVRFGGLNATSDMFAQAQHWCALVEQGKGEA